MKLSAVVTIGRREDSIPRLLEAVAGQTLSRDLYEVVIVDRTPDDHYAAAVRDVAGATGTRFAYETAPDWSRARANNIGFRSAANDVVYFLADDFIPPHDVFARHLAFHERRSETWRAVIGPAGRADDQHTDLTAWHEDAVGTFRPPAHADPDNLSPLDVTFTNTSVKRAFMAEHGVFDEDFDGEGFEDIELAVRLCAQGLHVTFDPSLHVVHDHDIGMAELVARWRICGRMARVFDAKHPSLRGNVEPQDATVSVASARYGSIAARMKALFKPAAMTREDYYLKRLQLAFAKGYRDGDATIVYPHELDASHR